MFNQKVTITVDAVAKDYELVSIQGNNSQRQNPAAEIGEPDILSVSHETKGSGNKAVERHLVRIDRTMSDTNDDGSVTEVTVSVYVVLVAPRRIAAASDVKNAFDYLVEFLTDTEAGETLTNVERVLQNVP